MQERTSMDLLVIQHDHASPLGPVADRFAERGYDLALHLVVPEERFLSPAVETEFPDFTGFDAVVLMGAPWSAYAEEVASWVNPEREQIRRADEAGVPMLGICFGGQLLASAFGGTVVSSPVPEIGWSEVASDDEAVVPSGRWFQWHYDRWLLPPGAQEIARNDAASQAFVLRRNLAVQFHPELSGAMLAGWLANGGATKATAAGLDAAELLAVTRVGETEAHARAHRLVDGFLDVVVAGRPVQARP
jgi:GMP synthase-like glutamine amidotransferase